LLGLDNRRALARTEIAPETGDSRLVCVVTGNYALPDQQAPSRFFATRLLRRSQSLP
jgi:hypothetical protein